MKNKKNNKNIINSDDIHSYLNTNKDTGLTNEEVEERRRIFGWNVIAKPKKTNFFVSFLKTLLFELMSLLLLITGLIGLALAIYENIEGSPHYILSYVQSSVLLSIVFINAIFGTIQEIKSSNAIDELEKMSSPTSKVLRNSRIIQIPSNEIVIGDIIIVEAGDSIAADAKLISDSHLKISESILTGESSEILKDADAIVDENAPIGDQKNKIFSGTNVLNGKGYGIVYAIANNTQIGKIASLLKDRNASMTPLQMKLQKLGKGLGLFGIIITIITFIFSLLVIENVISSKTDVVMAIQSSLLLSISLAAAAIPEGITAIVTIILSIGVKKMTTKNALIKKLPSVETLGSTAVICSDKTGTLTMNKMTVIKMWTPNNKDSGVDNITNEKKDLLIKASLCTDGVVDETKEISKRKNSIGDPTEIAILDLALKSNISVLNIKNEYQRINEIPFDSNRKLMSTINNFGEQNILIVKGAPDVVISKCKNIDQNEIMKINNDWSNSAIRVLAVAQKVIKNKVTKDMDIKPESFEFDLEFIGLIGMIDPPREEVKLSIKECKSAGIKPVMITGDHLNTAIAIAKDLGIISNENKELAITGAQLDSLSDEEFIENIEKYSVFARVSPENKIRIVEAWQKKGQVVAMTGDGVNDAPALKAADIGCAMGITGTDVSKQAADMILMDDNFSTIVESIKLGRNIYESIRRITKFLLSSNVTGVFSIFIGMIIFYLFFQVGGWGIITKDQLIKLGHENISDEFISKLNENVKFQTTITTIQILINHMVIETFPGVALGTQISTTNNLMNRRPRSKYESIFANNLIWEIIFIGIVHGILIIIAFIIGYNVAISTGAPLLRFYYGTMSAFLTFTIGGVLKSISMSSSNFIWNAKWNETKWIYLTSLISFSIIFVIMLTPKLGAVISERPELVYENMGLTSEIIEKDTFNEIISKLSGNTTQSSYMNWSIYITGISFGILLFISLELRKVIVNKLFNKDKKHNVITEFKLIEKPKTKWMF